MKKTSLPFAQSAMIPSFSKASLLLLALAFLAVPLWAQQDLTPPSLRTLTISPTQVDTSVNPATVAVTARITDDLSGFTTGWVQFFSPTGQQVGFANFQLVSGTNLNGMYQANVTIPAHSEAGTWTLISVFLQDSASNVMFYSTAQLQGLGFPTSFQVTSAQTDSTAPNLTSLSIAPAQVDTTSSAGTVTVTSAITDDISGFASGYVEFDSPSGNQIEYGHFELISGTNLNGTYHAVVTFPMSSEPGTWTITSVSVQDTANNTRYYSTSQLQGLGFPTTVQIVSTQTDVNPPVLNGLAISPAAVDTKSNSANITVTAQVSDDATGVTSGWVKFYSPSEKQSALANLQRTSGTNLNGTYQAVVTIPAHSEAGTWTIVGSLQDNASNSVYYSTAQLQTLGFPTTIEVNPNSVIVAASVNPSGIGQPVTLTATITSNGVNIPTGTVTFSDGSTQLATIPVNDTGRAIYTTPSISAGSHSITASYSGDANFLPGTASLTQQVIGVSAVPTISPAHGTFTSPQLVTISDATPGASIYYTLDGTPPTINSTLYTGPFTVSTNTAVSAIAAYNGYGPSPAANSLIYIVAAKPTIMPAYGTFNSPQQVTISDATPGVSIYYTLDGTTPTTKSTLYTGPLTLSSTAIVSAVAVGNGYGSGSFAIAPIYIVAARPNITPGYGTFNTPQQVTISDATPGVSIYYTLDGTAPTTKSTLYTGPFTVSSTATVSAVAAGNGYGAGSFAVARIYIVAAKPAITPAYGTFNAPQQVTISDATPGVSIYYTLDGTTPTTKSTLYTGPFTVSSTATVSAVAAGNGYGAGSFTSAPIYIVAAKPVITPAYGTFTLPQQVTISDATPGVSIYYTLDGTTPTTKSTLYTGPITVSSSTTISAVAAGNGYGLSSPTTASIVIKP